MGEFELNRILGTWHVVATTFPMWLKGDKTEPCFHYGLLPDGRLSDRVTYRKAGRERRILGTDTRLPGVTPSFRWRGRGLLAFVTSDWQIPHHDPDYRWAVVTFTKSLFTPAGLDIIARDRALSASDRTVIDELIAPHSPRDIL